MDNNTDNSPNDDISLLQSNAFAKAVASRESVVAQDTFSARKKREESRKIVSGYQTSNIGVSRNTVSPITSTGAGLPTPNKGGTFRPPVGPRPL